MTNGPPPTLEELKIEADAMIQALQRMLSESLGAQIQQSGKIALLENALRAKEAEATHPAPDDNAPVVMD